jgi:hypothetical protein
MHLIIETNDEHSTADRPISLIDLDTQQVLARHDTMANAQLHRVLIERGYSDDDSDDPDGDGDDGDDDDAIPGGQVPDLWLVPQPDADTGDEDDEDDRSYCGLCGEEHRAPENESDCRRYAAALESRPLADVRRESR